MHVQADPELLVEHIAQSALSAVADLNAAIRTASTRHELVLLRELASALVQQIEQSERAALLRDEYWKEQ